MGTKNEVPAGQWAGRRDIFDATVTGAITLPEFKTITANGKDVPVLKFSVCTNKVRKQADGKVIQYAEFPRVAVWGPLAPTLASLLTKGSIVVVKGDFRSNTYKSTKFFAVSQNGMADRSRPATFTQWEINVGSNGSVNIMHLRKEGDKAANSQPAAGASPAMPDLATLLSNIKTLKDMAEKGQIPNVGAPFTA